MPQRVQKLLSNAGYTSRRDAERLIEEGRVSVNGDAVTLGDKATRQDTIRVDNEPVEFDDPIYLAFHKPPNVLSTLNPVSNRESLPDYLEHVEERVYPAGRLDYDAEGLIILTNDGDFANTVMHPSHEKQKTYKVTVNKPFRPPYPPHTVELEDGPVTLNNIQKTGRDTYLVTIHEGRKHIVKRIIQSFNRSVTRLVRTRIGPVQLDIAEGETRDLTKDEVEGLQT